MFLQTEKRMLDICYFTPGLIIAAGRNFVGKILFPWREGNNNKMIKEI